MVLLAGQGSALLIALLIGDIRLSLLASAPMRGRSPNKAPISW